MQNAIDPQKNRISKIELSALQKEKVVQIENRPHDCNVKQCVFF